MNIYMAPMEGITVHVYRRAYFHHFGQIDRYFIPFLSSLGLNYKELRDISPENNQGMDVVPQILTNHTDIFLGLANMLRDYGYREVNLNLGCPSGTVTAKGRGSGFLRHLEELDGFLEEIFAKSPLPISVKTRVGYASEGEWPAILELLLKYPFTELIIHPRLRQDFYKGSVRTETYALAAARVEELNSAKAGTEAKEWSREVWPENESSNESGERSENRQSNESGECSENESSNESGECSESRQGSESGECSENRQGNESGECSESRQSNESRENRESRDKRENRERRGNNGKLRLCYNGDINTVEDYHAMRARFPDTGCVMLGRGLIANPGLAGELKGQEPMTRRQLKGFLDEVLEEYRRIIPEEKNALFRLLEMWSYLARSFENGDKLLKKVRKCKSLSEYKVIVDSALEQFGESGSHLGT